MMLKCYSRKVQKIIVVGLVAGLGCALAVPAAMAGDDPKISVGLGAAYVPDYEGSDDSEAYPAVHLSVEWQSGRYIKTMGQAIQANLVAGSDFKAGVALQFRKERDDSVDNLQVSRMRKIDSAFEAGAFVGYDFGQFEANLQVVSDVSDEHDGLLSTLRLFYKMKHSEQLKSRIGISATYADDDYMDTYFSVNAQNRGTSTLIDYTAASGMKDYGISYTANYACTSNWGVIGSLGFTKLVGDASDSPIVDVEGDDSQFNAALMATYTF